MRLPLLAATDHDRVKPNHGSVVRNERTGGDGPDGSTIAAAATSEALGAGTSAASSKTQLSDAQPFEDQANQGGGNVQTQAAQGVSEEDEAECHSQYEMDMEECSVYKGVMGARWMDQCSQKAFQRYQQCQGY